MTALPPLLTSSSDEFELALLRSAGQDAPDAAALLKTATKLGIDAAAVSAPLTTVVSEGVGASTASRLTLNIVVKFFTVGAVSAFVLVGGTVAILSLAQSRETSGTASDRLQPLQSSSASVQAEMNPQLNTLDRSDRSALPSQSRNPGAMRQRNVAVDLRTPAAANGDGVRSVETPTPNPGGSVASFALPASSTPVVNRSASPSVSISEQIATIDRVRQSLKENRPRDALMDLDRYRMRWPAGVLTTEAVVLRVQANLQLGDRAAADREAAPLLASQPNSRYAARLRALLDQPKR